MSSSSGLSLPYLGQQLTIYGGLFIMLTGILGNSITLIVFLSLKTFRQNSCAFYLTIMSCVNTGQLILGLLSRMLMSGFGIDWTTTSVIVCKFRPTVLQFCSLLSYSCLCLATLDQYFATCTRPRWQQWSNIKLAHRLTILLTILSALLLLPYPIFLNHILLPSRQISCTMNNYFISQYRYYFIALLASGYIPDLISTLFGLLAYRNVQQIAYRTIPLVRRELDKQLTSMVLVQVVINLFTNMPFVTMFVISQSTIGMQDTSIVEQIQFAFTITLILFYTFFAVSRKKECLMISERFDSLICRARCIFICMFPNDFVDN